MVRLPLIYNEKTMSKFELFLPCCYPLQFLCAPTEKQDKGDLSQKGLSDNTKVAFGATKDHG